MKKTSKLIMALLVIFSCVLPFINPSKTKALQSTYTYAYVDTDDLSTRTCPSTSCDRVRHDEGGIIWLNSPRVVEVLSFDGDWAKVRYNYWGFTYEGYMLTGYLGGIKTVTLDQSYASYLRQKGFPESYVEKLTKMHAIHPNWKFEVSRVGTTLDYATGQEYYPLSKNLISTTNTSQLSTDPGAYNGSYVQFEPGWYAPSYQTLSYYLDARNFLDDNSIFMFEQLSYDSSQDEAIVQSLLNGTFLAGNYTAFGVTVSYAATFVAAGKMYGVSPVHLVARVLQEQGTNGSATSDMVSDGKVYYNYFNFNAYGSTTEEIIANALSYAKRRGWDTPYQAIFDGAEEISDGYLANAQDTLFYQKFNLVGNSSRYTHQYMANIQAPYSESYSTYYSYFYSGLLNSSFTFKIPVYDGMETGTEIATKSNNNNLNGLAISSCSLNPAFSSSISVYNCTVENNVTNVKASASAADSKATITAPQSVDLNVGSNLITITVTAEDQSKKEYKITVNRKAADNNQTTVEDNKVDTVIDASCYKNNGNYVTGFTLGEDVASVLGYLRKINSSATITMVDSTGKEITSGKVSTGQQIVVNLGTTKKYNVVVIGDVNGDGKISAIDFSKVKAHIINVSRLNGAYNEAADINKDGKISALDFSKVKGHILGLNTINQ